MLRAVIFDVDGVLINSMPTNVTAINQTLQRHGLSLSDLEGDHQASSIKFILERAEAEHGVHLDFDEFIAELGPIIDAGIANVTLEQGLVGFLDLLAANNIICAIGSSATLRGVTRNLNHLGIAKYFKVIVTAEDVQRHKPAPDIYLEVLKRLKITSNQAVVIEDAPAGAQAAREAGIPVIGFGLYNDRPDQSIGADDHVTTWDQISLPRLQALIRNA